ncbi:pirin family protein [Carnimonas bestiolae]|uniref:pirin family protein n=1 Tax=Carnimonas bestiolae TaxID=3402172 RepID=UPI003EDBD21F
MIQIRRAMDRGHANHGWLNSFHTFSFADYFDPREMGFSDLRVINDDRVSQGKGFGRHPHRDMEIFSYVLEGKLEHRDNMGNGSVIAPGDVQLMSAGSGVLHSEFNPSANEPVHFLQIWVVPDARGYTPRYLQQHFSKEQKQGQLRQIIRPEKAGDTAEGLPIRQDVRVYAGNFDAGEQAELSIEEGRFVYVHVARGHVVLNGQSLSEGDGARIRDERLIELSQGDNAEVLVFDLRGQELPMMLS